MGLVNTASWEIVDKGHSSFGISGGLAMLNEVLRVMFCAFAHSGKGTVENYKLNQPKYS